LALALGVDLGGTNVRAAAVRLEDGSFAAARRELHADRSPGAVVLGVVRVAREAAAAAGLPAGTPLGVGVAAQCRGGRVLNAPNLAWRDVPFAALLAEAWGAPVRVANDLSAAALGEQRFGAARGVDDAALVFVGSGVGAGLILGGRLHEGAGGLAGELGHVKVGLRPGDPGRPCGCGQRGCLEAYAGGVNLAARLREDVAAGRAGGLAALVGGDLARLGAATVEEGCARGDADALALWDEVGELLGDAVANLATLLDPACIVLGGGVLLGSPRLEERVRRRAEARVLEATRPGLRFARAALGDGAGLVGAALLAGPP